MERGCRSGPGGLSHPGCLRLPFPRRVAMDRRAARCVDDLGGMGPVDPIRTPAGKLFASFCALYSGLAIISIAGLLLAPVVHRFLHKLHVKSGQDQARNIPLCWWSVPPPLHLLLQPQSPTAFARQWDVMRLVFLRLAGPYSRPEEGAQVKGTIHPRRVDLDRHHSTYR